jgi:hypothetical protein
MTDETKPMPEIVAYQHVCDSGISVVMSLYAAKFKQRDWGGEIYPLVRADLTQPQGEMVEALLEQWPKDRFIGIYKQSSLSTKWLCTAEIEPGRITDFLGNNPAEAIRAALGKAGG